MRKIRQKSVRRPYGVRTRSPVPTPYQPRTNPVRAYGVRTASLTASASNPCAVPYEIRTTFRFFPQKKIFFCLNYFFGFFFVFSKFRIFFSQKIFLRPTKKNWYEIRTKSVRNPRTNPRTNPVRAYGVRTAFVRRAYEIRRTNPVPTPYVPFGGSYDPPPLQSAVCEIAFFLGI